ncbi:MAG TPA: serine hydrolase [Ktedonobacteraceae bacterium]|nr:serine hydrolase [Ktedonobacteraceae bacterium]
MSTHIQRDYWPTMGWRESSPEEQGMDPKVLSGLDTYIAETRPYLNTLLIVRHGHIVFERYYKDYNLSSYQVLNSATKSIVSALIGIALQEGYLKSLDQRWEELLPEYFTAKSDRRKKEITIRHLLKMTSGLNPDFLAYPGRFGDASEDWVRYAIEKPVRVGPDQLFMYSSLGSHLLSVMLSRVTEMSTVDFARHYLFAPLGIDTDEQAGFLWKADPLGYAIGGVGLQLKARDAAKFGYLYVNNGTWDGRQIIPAAYVHESTREHNRGGHPEATGYGYHWWVTEVAGHHSFYAAGYGGQYIHVFPDLDTVIVMFAPDEPALGVYHRQFIPTLFVIPAIKEKGM